MPRAKHQSRKALPADKLKLDRTILLKVFSDIANEELMDHPVYQTPFTAESALAVIHRASQVCQTWRNILLASPEIWSRCVELDLLNQKSGQWRDLVLARTGSSLLRVIGLYTDVQSKSGLFKFIENLFLNYWDRIEKLVLHMRFTDKDTVHIWNMFCRPAYNLKEFLISSHCLLQKNFTFFVNISPSLRLFHVCNVAHGTTQDLILLPVVVFPSLTNLKLHKIKTVNDKEILSAIYSMPLLKTLDLHLSGFTATQPPGLTSVIPQMPRLEAIAFSCNALEIYQALLLHINTAPGCTFKFIHDLQSCVTEPNVDLLSSMTKALKRLGISYFQNDSVQDLSEEEVLKLWNIKRMMCSIFQLPADETKYVKFHVGLFISPTTLHLNLFRGQCVILFICKPGSPFTGFTQVFNAVSSFAFPPWIKKLYWSECLGLDVTKVEPDLSNFFKSLTSITEVTLSSFEIVSLLKITGELLFPKLETVILLQDPHWVISAYIQMFSLTLFLSRRFRYLPLKRLHLKSTPAIADFRFLDVFAGLEVQIDREGRTVEYICGSGDADCLRS